MIAINFDNIGHKLLNNSINVFRERIGTIQQIPSVGATEEASTAKVDEQSRECGNHTQF